MLVSQNLMGSNNNFNGQPATNGGGNRVTINLPNNKLQLRKTESTPINGILKNGANGTTTSINTNGITEHKNITFGNM